MSITIIIVIIFALVAGLTILFFAHKKVPRRLKVDQFVSDWKELQGLCKDKQTWPNAIQAADKLFDKALKKRRFKGKRMGERMVSAQRSITNNDQMWFAHNLAKKVVADPALKLREADVKQALIGFRQALKDIGALQQPDTASDPAPTVDATKEGKK